MRTTYYDDDDILVIRLSDKPITREVSQDWNTHVSYAADGTAVEVVVLDARASGALPGHWMTCNPICQFQSLLPCASLGLPRSLVCL